MMDDKDEPTKRVPLPWLQWMPNWLEFGLVFGVTLWPFVQSSLTSLFTTLPDVPITQDHLNGLIAGESVMLALVAPFLYARGWTVSALRLFFDKRDVVRALFLWLLSYVGYIALWMLFAIVMPDATKAAADTKLVGADINTGTAVAVSVINGFFEELFVCAYLIQSIRPRFGVIAAINVSVLVRLSYHLYQGPIGVIGIVPFGLIFAWVYVRTGRLWPLIIAHALQDMLGLV